MTKGLVSGVTRPFVVPSRLTESNRRPTHYEEAGKGCTVPQFSTYPLLRLHFCKGFTACLSPSVVASCHRCCHCSSSGGRPTSQRSSSTSAYTFQ